MFGWTLRETAEDDQVLQISAPALKLMDETRGLS